MGRFVLFFYLGKLVTNRFVKPFLVLLVFVGDEGTLAFFPGNFCCSGI